MSEDKINFYDFGEYRLDVLKGKLLKDGSPVSLSQKSFEILQILIENRNRVLKKEEILQTVWSDCHVEEANLTQHIYLLRKTLRQDGKIFIKTISKNGYRFVAEVEEIFCEKSKETEAVSNDLPASVFPETFPQNKFRFKRSLYIGALIGILIFSTAFYFYQKGSLSKTDSVSSAKNRYTKNVEAHQAYLMGLYHWDSRTEDGLKKAISYFQKAIEKDPEFALAYADLADTYALIGQSETDFLPKDKAMSEAKKLAQKALSLNPKCSEAMTSLAIVEESENRVDESYRILKNAIEMNPNNPIPHQRIAWIYAMEDRLDKAIDEMSLAQKLSPQSRSINLNLATLLNIVRRPDESMKFSRRLLELDANNLAARLKLAESLEQLKLYDEAVSELRRILVFEKDHKEALIISSRIYAKNDQREYAEKILEQFLLQGDTKNFAYQIALAHKALGNTEETLEWLKKSVEKDRDLRLLIKNDYNLDSLRKTPEFDKIQS